MIKHFINLQWKSFTRAASFKANLAIKIILGFVVLFYGSGLLAMGSVAYFGIEKAIEEGIIDAANPIEVVNRYLIYWFAFDLLLRYFFQKMPVANIKPLLYLPFEKGKIVKFALGKTILSVFNILPALFFIPFTITLLAQGYDVTHVIAWHVALLAITISLNFLNVFINNLNKVFYPIAIIVMGLGFAQYQGWFDITVYTLPIFQFFYEQSWAFILPVIAAGALGYSAYHYFLGQLYLDDALSVKVEEAQSEDLSFLDRFGNISTYLKNDIKLIKRNKRAKITFIMGFAFVLYGFFFVNDLYSSINGMKVFAGLFVTGGFLFSFGGLVPSWDSSYYKLMMSQNIPYRDFLLSKWWLMVVATVVSFLLSTFYIYFGLDWYLAMVCGAIYNIGFNASVVLWGGAYVKTPIDLTSTKKAFGDSKAFNAKTLLLTLPKLVLPVVIYYAFAWPLGEYAGFAALAITGVLGLAFRNKIFDIIENVYKSEKYDTIAAYAEKN